jgi:DNA primase
MPEDLHLDAEADDQGLLDRVVGYYHQTLKQTPEPVAYLHGRGITNGRAIDAFRLGYADRSLGARLPSRRVAGGKRLRARLERLGLFRATGHEHFRGSVTVPVPAADGSGQIVDVYGRKTADHKLRKGTPLHTHLNAQGKGVWNVAALGAGDEVVLCGSLWDALSFWSHGYRNVTCMFGSDALTEDLQAAFRAFRIQRVLTTCLSVTTRLLAAGLDVFLVKLPLGLDVNAYARQVNDPADALGSLLRSAQWLGNGGPPTITATASTPAETPQAEDVLTTLLQDDADELESILDQADEPADEDREQAVVRVASPLPPVPQEIEAEVGEDQAVLTFGNRRYRVRGLARNTALDVLRVNLLVTNGTGLFVDTFDLYSARHRQAFLQQAASELGVEEATVRKDLGSVLLKLEQLQEARSRPPQGPAATPEMPEQEKQAALALLRDPNLLGRIVSDLPIVGEKTNKLVGFLAALSRKLDQPLAVLIQSSSAAGKTTLMEAILGLVPPEEVVKYSAVTGQSLYYMAEGNLRHKVLAIVEEEGAEKASYALKLLQSEGELRIASTGKEATSGRLVTQEYRVEGPVMLFLTTTSIQVDEELLNRCLLLTVDEDREQTRQIHRLQRRRQTLAGQLDAPVQQETLLLHRNAQRLLRPLLVVNPFAERLTFLDDKTRTRRDHLKYLTLIRSITLLHQYQRPIRTVERQGKLVEYVEATLEDIALANELATELLGRSLDELPPQTRRLLDLLDAMVSEACQEQSSDRADFRFSQRQVRDHTGWGSTQLKVHLRRLVELEYLLVHRERRQRRLSYELLYHGTRGGKVLTGLIDVEQLRRGEWSGSNSQRSGNGRPEVGPGPGDGPVPETDANPCPARATDTPVPAEAETAMPHPNSVCSVVPGEHA